MRYRVLTSRRAGADLLSIREWQSQPGSGPVAKKRLTSIEAALKELRLHPHRWPSLDHQGIRERPVSGHRIYYSIDETVRTVTVLRIFGPYQDRSTL